MADFGMKISKEGFDVLTTPTTENKKDFQLLSLESQIKSYLQSTVSVDTDVAHGLGFAPLFDAFTLEDSDTVARPVKNIEYGHIINKWRAGIDDTYLYLDDKEITTTKLFYVIFGDTP